MRIIQHQRLGSVTEHAADAAVATRLVCPGASPGPGELRPVLRVLDTLLKPNYNQ